MKVKTRTLILLLGIHLLVTLAGTYFLMDRFRLGNLFPEPENRPLLKNHSPLLPTKENPRVSNITEEARPVNAGAPQKGGSSVPPADLSLLDGKVHGIDISHFQGVIDWGQVRQDGIAFVFIKATGFHYAHTGSMKEDRFFESHWKGAKEAGIPCGPYHFYHPNYDPQQQAEYFLEKVAHHFDHNSLPPMLDVEYDPQAATDPVSSDRSISPKEYSSGVLKWLQIVEQRLGRRPVLYTNWNIGKNYLIDKRLGQYPLYIAHYDPTMKSLPKVPPAWDSWVFWQHSQNQKVAGIDGTTDHDVFNGTHQELKTFIRNSQ